MKNWFLKRASYIRETLQNRVITLLIGAVAMVLIALWAYHNAWGTLDFLGIEEMGGQSLWHYSLYIFFPYVVTLGIIIAITEHYRFLTACVIYAMVTSELLVDFWVHDALWELAANIAVVLIYIVAVILFGKHQVSKKSKIAVCILYILFGIWLCAIHATRILSVAFSQ